VAGRAIRSSGVILRLWDNAGKVRSREGDSLKKREEIKKKRREKVARPRT